MNKVAQNHRSKRPGYSEHSDDGKWQAHFSWRVSIFIGLLPQVSQQWHLRKFAAPRQQILLHSAKLQYEMQRIIFLLGEAIGSFFQLVRLHEAATKQEVRDGNQDCANKPSNSPGRH